MKIAIIGSGAAAMGVMTALRAHAGPCDIDVYDPGAERTGGIAPPTANEATGDRFRRHLYRTIRTNQGLSFPPPKSHFGTAPDRHAVDGKDRLWKSNFRGGLTTYWGASVLPFTDHELRDWPISAADLAPHYARIADEIGISGARDGLNAHFPEDFVNRPPIRLPPALERLRAAVDEDAATPRDTGHRLFAGVSRVAVETRDEHPNSCIYCGDCMTGCARGAIYGAARAFADSDKADFRYIRSSVLAIDPTRRTLVLAGNDGGDGSDGGEIGEFVSPAYDRIYLCAGCIASTHILMRSYAVGDPRICADNAVYTLPMVHIGRQPPGGEIQAGRTDGEGRDAGLFALTNLLIGCVPGAADEPTIQVQIYATSDYYWRFYAPALLWPLLAPIGNMFRRRLFWARFYLPSDRSQAYTVPAPGEPSAGIGLARPAPPPSILATAIDRLRGPARRAGFVLPPVKPITHGTSSHYGCTFAYGTPPLNIPETGEVSPGVYVCDSTVFPSLPAISPTFTIMANAHRTTVGSLGA